MSNSYDLDDDDEYYDDDDESLIELEFSSKHNVLPNEIIDESENQDLVYHTANTFLYDYTQSIFEDRLDVTIKCELCNFYLPISSSNDHKDYHNALKLLEFNKLPDNLKQLNERRIRLIRLYEKMNIENATIDFKTHKANEWSEKIQKINQAYELVKSYVQDTFELYRRIKRKIKTNGRADSRFPFKDFYSIIIGTCLNKNEAYVHHELRVGQVLIESFGGNSNKLYMGLFDGHEGNGALIMCMSQLHLALLKNLSKYDSSIYYSSDNQHDEINNQEKFEVKENEEQTQYPATDEAINDQDNIKKAFIESYHQMDKLLKKGKYEKVLVNRWSGATCATCIIDKIDNENCFIHIANCGDVEAILISNEKSKSKKKYKVLTKIHNINKNDKEKERLEKNGSKLIKMGSNVYTIDGQIDVSRALGFHGDSNIKKNLTCFPSFKSIKTEAKNICLIVATRGFWNVIGYERVADLVHQTIASNIALKTNDALNSTSKEMLVESISDMSANQPKLQNEETPLVDLKMVLNPMKLIDTQSKFTQVTNIDINHDMRNFMEPKLRNKLELTQILTETLVNTALLSGARKSIALNCVLLPGFHFS